MPLGMNPLQGLNLGTPQAIPPQIQNILAQLQQQQQPVPAPAPAPAPAPVQRRVPSPAPSTNPFAALNNQVVGPAPPAVNDPGTAPPAPAPFTFGQTLSTILGRQNAPSLWNMSPGDTLQAILDQNRNESFLSGLGGTQIGMPQIQALLQSGNITDPQRQQFLNTLLALGFGGAYDPGLGIMPGFNPPGQQPGAGGGSPGGPGGGGGPSGAPAIQGTPLDAPELRDPQLTAWLDSLLQNGVLGDQQGTFDQAIQALLAGPQGDILAKSPADLLADSSNAVSARVKSRERDLLQRAGQRFASRGILDSGLTERGFRDIESSATETLADALSNLNLQGTLGFGQLELNQAGLAQQGMLGALGNILGLGQLNLAPGQLLLGRELGQGELGLEARQQELQRLMQEMQMNLLLQSGFFGADGAPGDPQDIGAILNMLPFGPFNNPGGNPGGIFA